MWKKNYTDLVQDNHLG